MKTITTAHKFMGMKSGQLLLWEGERHVVWRVIGNTIWLDATWWDKLKDLIRGLSA